MPRNKGASAEPSPQMLTWKRVWLILILIGCVWLLVSARAALIPLAISFILAYLLQPLVDFLESRKIPRTLAILLLLLGLGLLLFFLWASIAPVVQKQISAFGQKMPGYIRVVESWLIAALDRLRLSQTEELKKYLAENLAVLAQIPVSALRTGGSFLLRTTSGLFSIAIGVAYFILIPVMTFYILRDRDHIAETFLSYVHRDYRAEVQKRVSRLDELLGAFIKGQLLIALILSAFYVLGFFIVDMPLWLVLGIFTGISCMFPYVEWIVALPVALLLSGIAHQDWLHPLATLGVFATLSPLAGAFLVPRILGNRVGLHPVVVLASIMIGGELMGFGGILLAVPLAAAIKVGLEAMYDYYLA